MEDIVIKTKKDTPFIPNVNFNVQSGECTLEGESFMDNTFEFYSPLISWLKTFCLNPSNHIVFNVRLTYFNTSTSRLLLEMLEMLADFTDNGGTVEVFWYCYYDDSDMRDEIEDFEEETGLEIEIEEIKR